MTTRKLIPQLAKLAVLLAGLLAATSEPRAAPAKKCAQLANWSARADAIKERVYINPASNGRTLLEYTTSADDEVYLFFATAKVAKGDYRLSASIETGESPVDFEVSFDGGTDRVTGKEIRFAMAERLTFQVIRTIQISKDLVTLRIRSKPPTPAKVWSFISKATLCPA